jgi:hypothetical protein
MKNWRKENLAHLKLKSKGTESRCGRSVTREPDEIRRPRCGRRQESGAIWCADCDVELGNTRSLAVKNTEGIVLAFLKVDRVSARCRSVIIDGLCIRICGSPARVGRGADPNESGIVNQVKGKCVGACLASVNVAAVVKDKVRLGERRRAVDALWGAVLEADAADDVGDVLVIGLDCLCSEARISADGIEREANNRCVW